MGIIFEMSSPNLQNNILYKLNIYKYINIKYNFPFTINMLGAK